MKTDETQHWLSNIGSASALPIDGIINVKGYSRDNRFPEEVLTMEKAKEYGATAVFFEVERGGKAPKAQAFIYANDSVENDTEFALLHKKLWSWGGVPLVYRKVTGAIQLFRCAHGPDFISKTGEVICNPVKTLNLASKISSDPWWNAEQIRNGTIWDDAKICSQLLSAHKAAHKALIDAVKKLNNLLNEEGLLPKNLRRKLLILSLLIAYLEQKDIFEKDYFCQFLDGAEEFFQVLANGTALVALLKALEARFNGNVFSLDDADKQKLTDSRQLNRFSKLVEGREIEGGQLSLWKLYSFQDLPVELISHIYQLFVNDTSVSVYTPPFLVRLMLEESLSWERLDRLIESKEVILDPSCGSGVFLVEAYKRLVLHWRSRNNWKKPNEKTLKELLKRIRGVDIEEGAIELAAFSLCLALCDALEPQEIRSSIKLFPGLAGTALHNSCFFDAKENNLVKDPIGVILGNPPFASALKTHGAKRSYESYQKTYGLLPDKQIGYLFLHDAMQMLSNEGILCMLQQYNFLYNQQSSQFRQRFIAKWDVREILDFISVRGLFQKGDADTKIVVVVAEARQAPENRSILHATFRRSGRIDAEQGFDLDYYDMHWIKRDTALKSDYVWRSNLFGGGRTLDLIKRLKSFRTLKDLAQTNSWNYGEGFIEGGRGISKDAAHIVGKPLLRSEGLTSNGIDPSEITVAPNKNYEGPRSEARFTPPMMVIRENMELQHAFWNNGYLTYTQRMVGFCAPKAQAKTLMNLSKWISVNKESLKAYVALISPSLFIQKATAIQADDIFSIPFPENEELDISDNEKIIIDDVIEYYRDLIRLGDKSKAMSEPAAAKIEGFNNVYTAQINSIYKSNNIKALEPAIWPGIICQPFVFGNGKIDWTNAETLQDKIKNLLHERGDLSLRITRVVRLYDKNFIFLIKPNILRFWLKSVALRDADETLADLRLQGF